MAVSNSLTKTQEKEKNTMSSYLTQDIVKKKINDMLGGERGSRFIAAVSSAVTTNSTLQECTQGSILNAALLGESLNLTPSPQLGQYYLVPFNDNKIGHKVAQFQLGYKGYIQLAIRSGYYKKLNVIAIKEGELIKFDPLNEEIEVKLIEDEEQRENTKTTGYYAMFEYENGFRKAIYWSRVKMEAHAIKYSMGYKAKKGYTFWEKDFDGMAYKTMLRQLISKWGIMSIDLQNAVEKDMGVIQDNGTVTYIDNEVILDEQVSHSVIEMVEDKELIEEAVQTLKQTQKQENDKINTEEKVENVEGENSYEEDYEDPFK